MSKQEAPEGYQFRHAKRISLDEYRGIGNGNITLNNPIADGFMRVSDMRSDIAIVQKPQERVVDYEQVGHIASGKLLRTPRLEFWNKKGNVQVRKDNDTWYLAVDDQAIGQKATRNSDTKGNLDDRYLVHFRQEVNKGLLNILYREKLLNSRKFNLAFIQSYGLSIPNYAVVSYVEANMLTKGASIEQKMTETAMLASFLLIQNAAGNVINLAGSVANAFSQKIGQSPSPYPSFNDPFVKHSPFELIAPPVPVDRLGRGALYLKRHGNKLLTHDQPHVS